MHPTSFPGKYGCGDLGKGAYKIIDLLKKYGQKILQVLPLNPTGYGDSPYSSFSAFAGTPYIISFDILAEKGYLKKYPKELSEGRVNYGWMYIENFKMLRRAFENFKKMPKPATYDTFCADNKEWLEDYALFMAIKDSKNGLSWDQWEPELRLRTGLDKVSAEIKDNAEFYKFIQYEFDDEWMQFRAYANSKGIRIVGDAPIFVAYDSADVWSNQKLFKLDAEGKPSVVTGVPPL